MRYGAQMAGVNLENFEQQCGDRRGVVEAQ